MLLQELYPYINNATSEDSCLFSRQDCYDSLQLSPPDNLTRMLRMVHPPDPSDLYPAALDLLMVERDKEM